MPDVILSLIDSKSLDSILSLPVGSIVEGMEKMSLRSTRPEYLGIDSRQFDVDLEERYWSGLIMLEKLILTLYCKNKTSPLRRKQSSCYCSAIGHH